MSQAEAKYQNQPKRPVAPAPSGHLRAPVIFVVGDDSRIYECIRRMPEISGRIVEGFATCEAFIVAYHPGSEGCLLIDAYLPGMRGLELLEWLRNAGHRLPSVMIIGDGDVSMTVQAMKAGAFDCIEKPISIGRLYASVEGALKQSEEMTKHFAQRKVAANRVASLTRRQRQVLNLVLAGHPSKNIAADLGISQRTVETHRASIMKKTGSRSLVALARLTIAVVGDTDGLFAPRESAVAGHAKNVQVLSLQKKSDRRGEASERRRNVA